MQITKLIVQGNTYKRTLEFSDQLTIISGEKTSGKSLVLSLIDYCLGKNKISLKVQTELAEHIDTVFLELSIDDEIFTISRGIKRNLTNFFVYYCDFNSIIDFIPEKMNKKELQAFLMKKLGTIEFKRTKNKARSNELTTETISFRDIFRYCYINQHDLGTHNFLSQQDVMKKYKNPISFEMIFDLVNFSQNDLQTEIAKTQNNILKNEKNKDNLIGYLEQRNNINLIELIENIDIYNEQISKLEERKKLLIYEQNKENEIKKSNADFVLLNTEIREIDFNISNLQTQLKELQLGISSNELLLHDYQSEMRDLKITEELNYHLKIDNHNLTCPLCSSKVSNNFSDENQTFHSQKNFSNIIKDITNKINLLNDIINNSKRKSDELSILIQRKSRKKEILTMALNEFSKDIHTPFLPELNSINVSINNLEKDREILLESKRVHGKISELDKVIELDKQQLTSLKKKLKHIMDQENKKVKIIDSLNKSYLRNLSKMKYDDLSDTYIDSVNYIPYYKGATVFEHDSGGLLECMQIAFLDSIISSPYAKFHPKILILDSISKYFGTNKSVNEKENDIIHDPEVYLNIFYMLVKLSKNAQIIVVENTPPNEMAQYEKYSFRNGVRGFIDLDKNEFLHE